MGIVVLLVNILKVHFTAADYDSTQCIEMTGLHLSLNFDIAILGSENFFLLPEDTKQFRPPSPLADMIIYLPGQSVFFQKRTLIEYLIPIRRNEKWKTRNN